MVPVAALLCLASSAPGQWTLNDGTKMSFVFVKPSEKQAWRPSGEVLPYDSLPKPTEPVWSAKDSEPMLIALLNPPKQQFFPPQVRFKLPASSELNASFRVVCGDGKIWMAGYRPTTMQPAMQDLAVGVAAGGWRVMSWVEYRKAGNMVHAVKVHGSPLRLRVYGNQSDRSASPKVIVELPSSNGLENVTYKFTVKSSGGREMPSLGMERFQPGHGIILYSFVGRVEDVAQVILQVRTYEWHTLRVAHFRPNSN